MLSNRNLGFALILVLFHLQGFAQEKHDSIQKPVVSYGSKGFQFLSADKKYLLQIQSRLQFRFATPADQDPVTYDDFNKGNKRILRINRARLKIGGHAYQPWLKYYFEYELSQSNLLDFRIMVEKWEKLSLKVGQWKVEYSRERFISSGEQQMMDRSIINRPFTLDRQQGVELYGHIKPGGIADFNYWAAILTGTGRGSSNNDDKALMYFGRFQWNFLGRPIEFEGGDLEFHEKPVAALAIAAVTNQSPYTRFSQAGGGSLEGFENGTPGQYRVNQYNIESALMYKGFSWQAEWHHKYIIDHLNNDKRTTLRGFYGQSGYFLHGIIDWWPKQLEMAGRYASFTPDASIENNRQEETSIAFNWFFKGHKNKLTSELSYFSFHGDTQTGDDGFRFRLQWDISF